MAGRDGLIEEGEWNDSRFTDAAGTAFEDLTFSQLLTSDLDGDGLVGVNEFYRFLNHRNKAAKSTTTDGESSASNDESETTTQPGVSSVSPYRDTLDTRLRAAPATDRKTSDQRMLFERAQIARRTKYQVAQSSRIEPEVIQRRKAHLDSIRERRQRATETIHVGSKKELARLRDIYKARLVRNRRADQLSPSSTHTSRRETMDRLRRHAYDAELASRRRQAFDAMKRQTATEQTEARRRLNAASRRGSRSARDGSTFGTRPAANSDIRGLIPDSPSRNRSVKSISGSNASHQGTGRNNSGVNRRPSSRRK